MGEKIYFKHPQSFRAGQGEVMMRDGSQIVVKYVAFNVLGNNAEERLLIIDDKDVLSKKEARKLQKEFDFEKLRQALYDTPLDAFPSGWVESTLNQAEELKEMYFTGRKQKSA